MARYTIHGVTVEADTAAEAEEKALAASGQAAKLHVPDELSEGDHDGDTDLGGPPEQDLT